MGLPNFSTSADTNSKIHHQDLGDATLPQGERKSSPGLIDVCKGLWREISWRLAGERIAEAAIERFAERLGKTSERIEELQVSLGRAGFLEKEKQAYTNPRHSVAVQLLEGPIAQYLGAVSGQADSILSATEREIINLLRFDDKIGNGAKGLKCDIITALRDANLNRRQKEFLVELDAKTLSGAEKSVGSLERSLTNGLRQFEAEIGNLCAEDRNFFNGSSLFVTQSDALITQGELDQVRTAYTKRRNDIFVTLSDELEKVVSAGDLLFNRLETISQICNKRRRRPTRFLSSRELSRRRQRS
jgi:hypothetical protein